MVRLISLLCLFITLCWLDQSNVFAQARSARFQNLNGANGLSQNTVCDILQDYRGLLWVGTTVGLNRFDGYDFKVFKHDAEDSTSLAHEYINVLFEDSAYNLWVGTKAGIHLYDPNFDSFQRFDVAKLIKPNPNKEESDSINDILAIAEISHMQFWIGTGGGLVFLMPMKLLHIGWIMKLLRQIESSS